MNKNPLNTERTAEKSETVALPPWPDNSQAINGASVQKNFSSWFDASSALCNDGLPLIVFRGDREKFDDFNGRREHGIFFSVEPERAAYYGSVRQYCLQVSNPIDFRNPFELWRAGGVGAEIIESIFNDYHKGDHDRESGDELTLGDIIGAIENGNLWKMDGTGGFHMHSWRALPKLCESYGFDAMIIADDGEGRGVGIDWVVLDSRQVKCVSDHAGLFIADSGSLSDFKGRLEIEKAKSAQITIECDKKTISNTARIE